MPNAVGEMPGQSIIFAETQVSLSMQIFAQLSISPTHTLTQTRRERDDLIIHCDYNMMPMGCKLP